VPESEPAVPPLRQTEVARDRKGPTVAVSPFGLSAIALSVVTLAACSSTNAQGTEAGSASEQEARAALFSQLRNRTSADAVYFADDLGDYLPTQELRVDGGSPQQLSPGVVTGKVVNAEVTAAYKLGAISASGEEDPDGVPVDKAAPDADWRVITFTFAVNDAWSNEVAEGSTITINVSTSGSQKAQTLVQGLESLDDAIAALDGTNQIGDAQFSIARSGALLGLIETDGITFPALGAKEDAAFVGTLNTPRQIAVAAQEDQPTILVENGVVADPGE
jgi:hypothetical protein